MTKLDTLSIDQAAWLRKNCYRCAYLVWPIFACIAALNAFKKDPSLVYLYGIGFSLVFVKCLHFISQHSNKPNTYLQIELLIAAFFQGILIGSVDLQVIPSLAILTPITAFAFIGNLTFLLLSLVLCFFGFVVYFFCIGINFYVVSDFDLNLVSIIAIIVFQVVFTLIALVNYGTFDSEQEEQENKSFVDKATGLKTTHYFDFVIDNKGFEFLSKERLKDDSSILVSLFLIRIDRLDKAASSYSQDFINKQIAEFSYDLFYLINSSDLLIRWQEDQLLLIAEKKPNIHTEKVAQSLVSSMHSHPIKGVELTPSIFCTDLCFIPTQTQKSDWFDKIAICQNAMSNKPNESCWQYIES